MSTEKMFVDVEPRHDPDWPHGFDHNYPFVVERWEQQERVIAIFPNLPDGVTLQIDTGVTEEDYQMILMWADLIDSEGRGAYRSIVYRAEAPIHLLDGSAPEEAAPFVSLTRGDLR